MSSLARDADAVLRKQIMQLGVLAAASALTPLTLCVMVAAMPGIATHFGGASNPVLMAQLLLVGPFVAQIFGAPLIGAVVGAFGRRGPLLFSMVLLGLAGLGGFVLEGFWTLLAARLVCGFTTAAILTITSTLAGDYFVGRMRDIAISWLGIMPSAGSFVTLLAAGYLASIGGWHLPFLLFLVVIPVLIAALFLIEEPSAAGQNDLAAAPSKGRLPAGMAALTFQMFVAGIALILGSVQLPFVLIALGITSPLIASTILGTAAFPAIVGAALYPWLRPRLGRSALLATILVLEGICYGGIGFASTVPIIWCLSLIGGFANGLVIPYFTGTAMDLASAEARPRAIALVISAMFTGWFVTPFIAGLMRGFVGDIGVFTIAGGGFALFGLTVLLNRRRPSNGQQREAT